MLARGERLVSTLNQGEREPLPVEDQTVQIYAATNGFLDRINVERVPAFLDGLVERMEVLPDRLLLYTDDGDSVLDDVHRRGLHPETSLVRRSTLEDVFLRLTGRTLVE